MKRLAALGGALFAAAAHATPAYVTDELVLGVYADRSPQSERLATLHSGAGVDALAVSGEFTQVRLGDGTTGWVKSSYLTTHVPATARVKQLEEELDRSRATTPALAEAAARSELESLKRELMQKQSELEAARAPPDRPRAAPHVSPIGVGAVLIGIGCGFLLGYGTLARRIRRKFGGLRIY